MKQVHDVTLNVPGYRELELSCICGWNKRWVVDPPSLPDIPHRLAADHYREVGGIYGTGAKMKAIFGGVSTLMTETPKEKS